MESNEFIATKDQLKNIRAFVRSLLNEKDFSKDEIEKIILAVGEASMNIVQHAYQGGEPSKKIKVDLSFEDKLLRISFFDEGIKANPSKIKPRKLEEIRPGGLGTHFIKMVMDDVQWGEPKDNWVNNLILKKRLNL